MLTYISITPIYPSPTCLALHDAAIICGTPLLLSCPVVAWTPFVLIPYYLDALIGSLTVCRAAVLEVTVRLVDFMTSGMGRFHCRDC